MVGYHKSSAPLSLDHLLIDQINIDLTPIKFSLHRLNLFVIFNSTHQERV
jgi:hypothetical protein